jgi:hypothetical protein
LRRNVLLNQLRYEEESGGTHPLVVRVHELEWGASEDEARERAVEGEGPWDLVLGSDLVYLGETHAALVVEMDRYMDASSVLL